MLPGIRAYHCPPRIMLGNGAAKTVGKEAKALGGTRALVICDKGVLRAGLIEPIVANLKEAGVDAVVFDGVTPEPLVQDVEAGAAMFKQVGADMMVAVGGGSAMDTAKSIGILVNNPGPLQRYDGHGELIKNRVPPFITIPTTSGTGAEASSGSIIKDPARKFKMGIGNASMNSADVALCDPEMTRGLPALITAYTGMDALCHGIERYTNRFALPQTDALALHAVRYVGRNLRQAVADGENMDARYGMMAGSLMAGMARTATHLVHCVSHTLSAHLNVPHGLGNAIPLPYIMDFTLIGTPDKYADIAEALGEDIRGLTPMRGAKKSVQAVHDLIDDISIPKRLRDVGVSESDIPIVARAAIEDNKGMAAASPRVCKVEDMERILRQAY